jgi:hypothetical protein
MSFKYCTPCRWLQANSRKNVGVLLYLNN